MALRALRTWPWFGAALVGTLAAAGFAGGMVALMALRMESLLPGAFAEMGHFTQPHHRTHDLTFGLLFVPAVVGVLVQLRSPLRNVAGQVMALVPSAALVLTALTTLVLHGDARVVQPPWVLVMAGVLVATALHPAGRDFFRSFTASRVSRPLLALLAVAVVPLLGLTATGIQLQGVADDHARMGHYGFMAAFGLTVIGVGAVASMRPDGWRVAAWVAGLLPVLLGLASMGYPDATSSLGVPWALAAVVWGVALVLVAERARRSELHPSMRSAI